MTAADGHLNGRGLGCPDSRRDLRRPICPHVIPILHPHSTQLDSLFQDRKYSGITGRQRTKFGKPEVQCERQRRATYDQEHTSPDPAPDWSGSRAS